ncbi:MAG: hypothetical protein RR232_01705 [Clostridia bacterium]
MNKFSTSRIITIGAAVTALTVISLYGAATLPTMRIAVYFLSSLFVYIPACEKQYKLAMCAFVSSAVIGLILIPNKLSPVLFIALLGHFGIVKSILDTNIRIRYLRFTVLMIYVNLCIGMAYLAVRFILKLDITAMLPAMPMWLIAIVAEACFAAFIVLYSVCQNIYEMRFRKHIIKR